MVPVFTGECCCGLPGSHATASQCLQAHTPHQPTSCSQQPTPANPGQDIFQVCVRAVGALPERHCPQGVWLGGCNRPAGPLLSTCAGLHCRSALHLPVFDVACMAGSLLQTWLQFTRLLCDDRDFLLWIAPLSIVFRSSAGGVFVHACKPCPSTSLGCAVLASRRLTSALTG